jgi:hypothetical protein
MCNIGRFFFADRHAEAAEYAFSSIPSYAVVDGTVGKYQREA